MAESLPRTKREEQTVRVSPAGKVRQMAFANLGRSRKKTVLVVISMALAVVLLNALVLFVTGMDTEKYLSHMTCGDFIVSSVDYFQYDAGADGYISEDVIREIREHTKEELSGCGYTTRGIVNCFMQEEIWRQLNARFYDSNAEMLDAQYETMDKQGDAVRDTMQLEALDTALLEKLEVLAGSLAPMYEADSHAIAIVVNEDDYGKPMQWEYYPAVGEAFSVVYADGGELIDRRTGEPADRSTPGEDIELRLLGEREVTYTVCALVNLPYAMGYRYYMPGYCGILPVEAFRQDSGQQAIPLFYLFDTPDAEAEAQAESYLSHLTGKEQTNLMYESKQTARKDFEMVRRMFLLVGGALCGVIGLVGILNFINAIMTSIFARQREFAMLNAVGMTKRQLKDMLVYEGSFYALFAAILAVGCSLPGNLLFGRLLQSLFWFFKSHFTIWPAIAALPVFLLLGWTIPGILYGQTAKKSIVEILRETE